jgi:hypothetical protein
VNLLEQDPLDEDVTRAPRKPVAFEEAEVIGPTEVETVEEADELIEGVACNCGNGAMEEVSTRKTRTKSKPRKHFERHFFRCAQCGTEKVLFLDVTKRRKLLGF